MSGHTVTLPSSPSETTLILLKRAKAMLDHALSHAQAGSALDRMIALHGFDNVIEYLLRIVAVHLDIENQTGKNLDTPDLSALAAYVDKFLEEFASIHLPYRAEIKLLRQVRNLVQHGVSDPRGDLKRFGTITSRFFEKLIAQVFGLQPDGIRVSSIIENQEVAGFLREAEEKMDSENYLEAIVMLRPWEESDATYCYGFVTDILLSWQNAPKERLYPIKMDREYRFDEYIDGQAIETEPLYGMVWLFENGEEFKVHAAKTPSRDILGGLEKGKTYSFLRKCFVDGVQETEIQEKLEVLDIRSQLITHRPPRWEVALRLSRKPFSWKRTDIRDEKEIPQSVNINKCTAEALHESMSHVLDLDTARRVVALRSAIGKISTPDDLRRVQEITEQQLSWLQLFTFTEDDAETAAKAKRSERRASDNDS